MRRKCVSRQKMRKIAFKDRRCEEIAFQERTRRNAFQDKRCEEIEFQDLITVITEVSGGDDNNKNNKKNDNLSEQLQAAPETL